MNERNKEICDFYLVIWSIINLTDLVQCSQLWIAILIYRPSLVLLNTSFNANF